MKKIMVGMIVVPLILMACSKEKDQTNSSTDPLTENFQKEVSSTNEEIMKGMAHDATEAVIDVKVSDTVLAEKENSKTMSYDDVVKLAENSGCLTCHALDKRKLVGPGWAHVAERYKGDPAARDALIQKVKDGGKGSWNDMTGGMSMPPYGLRVTSTNIQILVDFILSL